MCRLLRAPLLLLLFGLITTPGLTAQEEERFPLYTAGLGDLTRTILTSNPHAQAYFKQGLQLMYAFAKVEGRRSFQEASREDPTCAMFLDPRRRVTGFSVLPQ